MACGWRELLQRFRSMKRTTRLLIMLVLTFVDMVIELVCGYWFNSMTLIADSFHMISDVLALAIALVCIKIASRRTRANTFGWVRAELLGALVNGVFLLALCFTLFVDSIARLFKPEDLKEPAVVLAVGVVGLVVNIIGLAMFHGHASDEEPGKELPPVSPATDSTEPTPEEAKHWLRRHPGFASALAAPTDSANDQDSLSDRPMPRRKVKHDLNMRGVFLHLLSDLLGSVIVVICAIVVLCMKADWSKKYLDPALSIAMSILMCCTTVPLVYETALILLQTTPKDIDLEQIKRELLKIDGVQRVHDFHIWRLIGERIIATLHVQFRSVENYIDSTERVKRLFHANSVHSITLQPEFREMLANSSDDCLMACAPTECNVPNVTCCTTEPPRSAKGMDASNDDLSYTNTE